MIAVEPDTPASACGDEPLLLRPQPRAGRRRSRPPAAAARLAPPSGGRRRRQRRRTAALRLARDAQLIVFDERGAGNGWLLPAGPLREPMPRDVPARSVVLYNAAAPSAAWPGSVAQRRLAGATALADWWAGAAPSPSLLANCAGALLAMAGMARPGRFFAMLRERGLQFERSPADHHPFATLPWPAATAT